MSEAKVPESISGALTGSSITTGEVDAVLRDGGNQENSVLRIAAYYMKGKSLSENADFLRREYVAHFRDVKPSGKGIQFGADKLSVWFEDTGIALGRGDTAIRAADRVHVSWEQAANRIGELLESGEYINGDLLDEAIGNEHRELAESILYFYRDDLRDFREIPDEWRVEKGGWPEDVAQLTTLLTDRSEYQRILAGLDEDISALRTSPDAPRRFWHNPDRLLADLRDAGIPPRFFPSTSFYPPPFQRFITQDEVNLYLTRGSGYHAGKYRVLSFFLHEHTAKERADFLKNEYGHYGCSHALGGADDSWANCEPGKGIELQRGGLGNKAYDTVKITWSAAEKRIMGLIKEGRYMSRDELDRIPEYTAQFLAEQISSYFYNIPDEDRPYPSVHEIDNKTDQETLRAMLDDPEQVASILTAMKPVLGATASDDRLFTLRHAAYENLTAYVEGRFNLFPGLELLSSPETSAPLPVKRVEQAPEQFSLFSEEAPTLAISPTPILRGVEEQQARIEQAEPVAPLKPEQSPAVPFSQEEIDALLLGAVETESQYDDLLAQFRENPRSREAMQLVKRVYSDGIYLAPRTDGTEGTMGLAGDSDGVTISKIGSDKELPPIKENLSWPRVHRRVAELIEAGQFVFMPLEHEIVLAEDAAPESAEVETTPPVESEDDFLDIDVEAIRERLQHPTPEDEVRIVGMLAQAEQAAADFDAALNAEFEPHPYAVGDKVILEEGREFVIDDIGDHNVRLRDMTFQGNAGFPIFRSIGIAEFEQLIQDNPRSDHLVETASQSVSEPPPSNYRIRDDNLGVAGPKARFAANIAAIRTLRQIEGEGRQAFRSEQETLAQYVGWGGLQNAFDDSDEKWRTEYAELKQLLSPEEYDLARASTLNAHYSTPAVIRAIYNAIGKMGFREGNVLEPSCGVGHFFGLVPEEMSGAKLYGVELDTLSARIAEKLYPSVAIQNLGFEKARFPDSFFDVVVGNVPFGNYKVHDPDYNRHNFLIHDYFLAKSIDKTRAGGVVALITSNGISGGTLDKRDDKARRYLAERCDLIGAIRLPNNAFKAAAGTDVNTDILFLQKRETPRNLAADTPDWVDVRVYYQDQHQDSNGKNHQQTLYLNNYFSAHPEMVLGTLEVESGPFGPQLSCKPREGDLSEQLEEAISRLEGNISFVEPSLDDLADMADKGIPADPNVRNFSYTIVDNQVFFRENSLMFPVEYSAAQERIKGMAELRDCVHSLIDLQLNSSVDDVIKERQHRLNDLYDAFTAEHGLINSAANSRAFSDDSSYYLLCSLEILDENGGLERKADMFTKRTIGSKRAVTAVDTASEALAVSIGERAVVDLDYMSQLSGLSHEKLIEDLRGVIFLNVGSAQSKDKAYVTADEYLSGNIREKLAVAQAAAAVDPSLSVNVDALKKAMPKDLEASEISVRLGSTWVEKEHVEQFMHELLQSPYNLRNACKVNYSDLTGDWQITGTARVPSGNIAANVTYGTSRKNAYEIIHDTLNLRDVRVYDTVLEEGTEKRVLNKKETTLAQQKQEQIKQAFKDWLWNDPQRRQHLVRKYNDLFNSNRVREYDGSHIVFSGMNPELAMRPYQANAIARILYGGNTLLAHEVGAGKTFEMVAAAMESKRLGLCAKSMFAVPNHLIDQIAADFLRLYPSANILVARKKDFEMRNRKKFCARIATGDYDAVILGHSQLEKIPISTARQEQMLRDQLEEILEGIREAKQNDGARFTVKQLERTRKKLELRLEKIAAGKGRDNVVTFEQLGVDRLFVDEAHGYKNLFLFTKMRNVAGLSTTEAQKSNDLFLKCRYLDELTGGKGIIFATGTPVSNSMTELYTMQRYLQYHTLEQKNMLHFDAWASTFGETVTAMELAPEGNGYRARTRFARFHNLPELMNLFCDIADIKTADMLDLPRPEASFETVVVKPTDLQKEMVMALSQRAADVSSGRVDPKEDNMLKITSDGRKIGLDQRLIDPLLPDDPESKVNACMNNIYQIWRDTAPERLTQLVFCDYSTPNADGRFNVYDDIKAKLLEKGVPAEEIAFIHDASTDTRKKELFAKVRKGQVRVLFGSTAKMGAGTNVQDKLIAMHDLDCPWRPADLEQRAGRIVRFGNLNPKVHIKRYVTEGTFDAYLFQTVENKQKFISQIMTSKSPARTCEDVDETALSYAEIKALCSGNPLIKEKIDLDIEVARLRLLKSSHQSQHHRLEDNLIDAYPREIKAMQESIAGLERDMARLAANLPRESEAPASLEAEGNSGEIARSAKAPFSPMTVLETVYTEKAAAGTALLEACKTVKDDNPVTVGSYLGFEMSIGFDSFAKQFRLTLKGDMRHTIMMGVDPNGNFTRIHNALKVDMPQRLESCRANLENLHQQVVDAKKELEKPFDMEKELAEKEMRLALVNAELAIDDGVKPLDAAAAVVKAESESAKEKPSILKWLRDQRGSPPSSRTTDPIPSEPEGR